MYFNFVESYSVGLWKTMYFNPFFLDEKVGFWPHFSVIFFFFSTTDYTLKCVSSDRSTYIGPYYTKSDTIKFVLKILVYAFYLNGFFTKLQKSKVKPMVKGGIWNYYRVSSPAKKLSELFGRIPFFYVFVRVYVCFSETEIILIFGGETGRGVFRK